MLRQEKGAQRERQTDRQTDENVRETSRQRDREAGRQRARQTARLDVMNVNLNPALSLSLSFDFLGLCLFIVYCATATATHICTWPPLDYAPAAPCCSTWIQFVKRTKHTQTQREREKERDRVGKGVEAAGWAPLGRWQYQRGWVLPTVYKADLINDMSASQAFSPLPAACCLLPDGYDRKDWEGNAIIVFDMCHGGKWKVSEE